MIETLDGNEVISVSDSSWECFAVSPPYKVSGRTGTTIQPRISYNVGKDTTGNNILENLHLNPRIHNLEKNRISYLRENGAIKTDGTLETSMSDLLDPPLESEIFMGINFRITPDFDFTLILYYRFL